MFSAMMYDCYEGLFKFGLYDTSRTRLASVRGGCGLVKYFSR